MLLISQSQISVCAINGWTAAGAENATQRALVDLALVRTPPRTWLGLPANVPSDPHSLAAAEAQHWPAVGGHSCLRIDRLAASLSARPTPNVLVLANA